jgi:hypothetical protein
LHNRRFAIGFVIIFTVLGLFIWLEVAASRGQREINRIESEETALARAENRTMTAEFFLSATATSSPTETPRRPFNTFTPSPTATISGSITGTLTLTPTIFPSTPITGGLLTLTPGLTPTITPPPTTDATDTPTPGPSPTYTPKPTFTNTPVLVPRAFNLNGRVLWDDVPIDNVSVSLERLQSGGGSTVLTTTITLDDGTFEIEEVFPNPQGFNIVFENSAVQGFTVEEVVAWARLGVIEWAGEDEIDLPDMEIGNGTFDFEFPVPGGEYSISNLSASNPLEFDWTPYIGDPEIEIEYWVQVVEDTTNQATVWLSELDEKSSVEWDGITNQNNQVDPGDYLWGVGAIIQSEDGYELTIFSRLASLVLAQ